MSDNECSLTLLCPVCVTEGQDYAVPDVTKSALMVTFPQARVNIQPNNLDKPPPTYDALYAASDIVNAHAPNIPSLQVRSQAILVVNANKDLLQFLMNASYSCKPTNDIYCFKQHKSI